ncbi:MAG TPA: OmpA family protein [Blastocatellia bacterium]|nr:OmpA family protein [Blastocatellia bacterium]
MSPVMEYELESELESELEGEYELEAELEWESEGESEWEGEWEGEYENEWELESEWETPGTMRRPGPPRGGPAVPRPGPRRPITVPTITIRVRPFVVLRGFPHDRTTVTPANQRRIELAARRIVASWRTPGARRIRSVRLVGHADSSGPAAYNLDLGRRRAQAVRTRLMRAVEQLHPGLSRRIRFIPQTLGETRPEAPNTTPAGRARNRRVQIFLSDV